MQPSPVWTLVATFRKLIRFSYRTMRIFVIGGLVPPTLKFFPLRRRILASIIRSHAIPRPRLPKTLIIPGLKPRAATSLWASTGV